MGRQPMRLQIFALLGLIVSFYAVYVEKKADYSSFCDFGEGFSCSAVLTSEYSRLIGMAFNLDRHHPMNIPNTYYGILFYLAVFLYPLYPFTLVPFRRTLLLLASISSMALCFVLAYILKYILHDVCIVCISSWIVNFAIFVLSVGEFTRKSKDKRE